MQKLRAFLWTYRAFLWLLCILAGLYVVISAFAPATPVMEKVVVAQRDIHAGSVLSERDLREEHVPERLIPQSVVRDAQSIVGKTLAVNSVEGSALSKKHILSSEFLDSAPGGHTILPISVKDASFAGFLDTGTHLTLYSTPKNMPLGAENQAPSQSTILCSGAVLVGKGKESAHSGGLDTSTATILYVSIPTKDVQSVLTHATQNAVIALPSTTEKSSTEPP